MTVKTPTGPDMVMPGQPGLETLSSAEHNNPYTGWSPQAWFLQRQLDKVGMLTGRLGPKTLADREEKEKRREEHAYWRAVIALGERMAPEERIEYYQQAQKDAQDAARTIAHDQRGLMDQAWQIQADLAADGKKVLTLQGVNDDQVDRNPDKTLDQVKLGITDDGDHVIYRDDKTHRFYILHGDGAPTYLTDSDAQKAEEAMKNTGAVPGNNSFVSEKAKQLDGIFHQIEAGTEEVGGHEQTFNTAGEEIIKAKQEAAKGESADKTSMRGAANGVEDWNPAGLSLTAAFNAGPPEAAGTANQSPAVETKTPATPGRAAAPSSSN